MLVFCVGLDALAVLLVWLAPPAGESGKLALLGDVLDGFTPAETVGVLAIMLLLANFIMMIIADRDPCAPSGHDCD